MVVAVVGGGGGWWRWVLVGGGGGGGWTNDANILTLELQGPFMQLFQGRMV